MKNREGSDFILGPTHEETFTAYCARLRKIYKTIAVESLPNSAKYRDEKRPRNGLLRTREFIMKMVIASMLTTIAWTLLMMNTRQLMSGSSPAVASTTKPSSVMVVPWAEKIAKSLWLLHLLVTDLDRWVVLDKSVASFDEIPAEVQEEIKAELLKWMVSGEDTIAYSSESHLCCQLGNGYQRIQAK